jgi:hypothetical protein
MQNEGADDGRTSGTTLLSLMEMIVLALVALLGDNVLSVLSAKHSAIFARD